MSNRSHLADFANNQKLITLLSEQFARLQLNLKPTIKEAWSWQQSECEDVVILGENHEFILDGGQKDSIHESYPEPPGRILRRQDYLTRLRQLPDDSESIWDEYLKLENAVDCPEILRATLRHKCRPSPYPGNPNGGLFGGLGW
jgi:hypothetical protein